MAYADLAKSFLFVKNKEGTLEALTLLQTDHQTEVIPGKEDMCLEACNASGKLLLLLLRTFDPKYLSRLDTVHYFSHFTTYNALDTAKSKW